MKPVFLLPKAARAAGMTMPVTRAVPISEWHLHRPVLEDLRRNNIPSNFVAVSGDPSTQRAMIEVWREPARKRDRLENYRAEQA